MSNRSITPNYDLRPFDAAQECLTPRLREDGGLSANRLPESTYFRDAVGIVVDDQFEAPLSDFVSPEVMKKIEDASDWLRDQIKKITGRELSFIEPFVVRNLSALGSQQYPLVKIDENVALQIETAPPAQEMKEECPKFEPAETQEAKELQLISTVVHEFVHASRGIQIGRESLDAVRLGVRVNAFGAQPSEKRFSSLTEAAAVLTEGRFFTEHITTLARDLWSTSYFEFTADGTPVILDWPEMKALESIEIVSLRDAKAVTMQDRFIALLKETGVSVTHDPERGHEIKLAFSKYGNSDALVSTGYQHLHWGMELLATEIFRGRSKGALDSIKMFQEQLLKAEVLAEPRPVLREILNLAKKDVASADPDAALDERLLGKQYLHFFAHLRPSDPFDLMVFQAFVRANQSLPNKLVGQCRAELLDIYAYATAGQKLTPVTNAG